MKSNRITHNVKRKTIHVLRSTFYDNVPELPEVQTVVNDLAAKITGDQITGFWTAWPRAISVQIKEKDLDLISFAKKIKGQKILKIRRIGKYTVFSLTDDLFLLFHLRMTGQLIIKPQIQNQKSKQKSFSKIAQELNKLDKHVHHVFLLKKNGFLIFRDVRKFGTINLLSAEAFLGFKGLSQLGLDPMEKSFSLINFKKILQRKEKNVLKDILLNQSLISGIGNIYASEILFDAKLSPYRKANALSEAQINSLYLSIKKILRKAIRMRGTSVSDYRDSAGLKGSFQHVLRVYKKSGIACQKCATIIKKSVISQRSTFFCPKCQK